jgi:hypothetical protein
MAAPYNPPVKNEDFIIYVCVYDANVPNRHKVNPTIAAGDWQISKDGGAFANLATLPAVTPASGAAVKITLSSTEMNADNVLVRWADQTDPPEWADDFLAIPTTA